MNLDDFIVNIFFETENFIKKFFEPRTLRIRGPMPQLYYNEVLTMEIVGEFLISDYKHIFQKTLTKTCNGFKSVIS